MLDKRKLIIGKWPHFVQSNYAVYSAIYQILVNTIKLVKKKKKRMPESLIWNATHFLYTSFNILIMQMDKVSYTWVVFLPPDI